MKVALNCPDKARDYFKAKMEFATCPVEPRHMLKTENEPSGLWTVAKR